jgi:adenylate cyclase class IV
MWQNIYIKMTWKPPSVQQNNYTLQQKSTIYRNSSAVATIFDRLKFVAVEVATIKNCNNCQNQQ